MLLFANKRTKLKVRTFLSDKSEKTGKSERKSEFMCGKMMSEWKNNPSTVSGMRRKCHYFFKN